jgi:hypothetical protein
MNADRFPLSALLPECGAFMRRRPSLKNDVFFFPESEYPLNHSGNDSWSAAPLWAAVIFTRIFYSATHVFAGDAFNPSQKTL